VIIRKILLTTIAACSVATSACAAPDQAMTTQKFEFCQSVSKLAQSVMRHRQDGFPESSVMNVLLKSPAADTSNHQKFIIELVQEAYAQPQFEVEHNKQQEVTEFENDNFHACMDKVGG
jgi:hypothetical protein